VHDASDPTRHSASWELFTSRSSGELYLAQRELGADIKVSFHRSGAFQTSFVDNATSFEWQGVVEGGSRHLDQWQQPPEFAPGWTLVFEVIHPEPELRVFDDIRLSGKPHVSFPIGGGHATHVYVLRAQSPIATMTFSGAIHAATLELDANTAVVVVAMFQKWAVGAELLQRARERSGGDAPANFAKPGVEFDPTSTSARFTVHGTHVGSESRFVIGAAGAPV
jgi:hypothetical protein